MRRTHIILPDDLANEIDAVIGKRGRSEFFADAARHELRRRRQAKTLVNAEGAWKDENHPELRDGSAAYVERQRRSDEAKDSKRRGRLLA